MTDDKPKGGCGPGEGLGDMLVPDAFPGACEAHDKRYGEPGGELDRMVDDAVFLRDMLREAWAKPWYIRPVYLALAPVYWVVVRLLGWLRKSR